MDLNRLCVFFLQKKRLKLPVRLQQAGKFASGFQWMFPGISADVSGDFCGCFRGFLRTKNKNDARNEKKKCAGMSLQGKFRKETDALCRNCKK